MKTSFYIFLALFAVAVIANATPSRSDRRIKQKEEARAANKYEPKTEPSKADKAESEVKQPRKPSANSEK